MKPHSLNEAEQIISHLEAEMDRVLMENRRLENELQALKQEVILRPGFSHGVVSMARNCLPALKLVVDSKWSLDNVRDWLNAVITNDATYLTKVYQQYNELKAINDPPLTPPQGNRQSSPL